MSDEKNAPEDVKDTELNDGEETGAEETGAGTAETNAEETSAEETSAAENDSDETVDEPVMDGAEEPFSPEADPRKGMSDPALIRDIESGEKTVNPYA